MLTEAIKGEYHLLLMVDYVTQMAKSTFGHGTSSEIGRTECLSTRVLKVTN